VVNVVVNTIVDVVVNVTIVDVSVIVVVDVTIVDVSVIVVVDVIVKESELTVEVRTLPIPEAARSETENDAMMGMTKPALSTIFLRIARREGFTDANILSSFSSLIIAPLIEFISGPSTRHSAHARAAPNHRCLKQLRRALGRPAKSA
jgi:hypothetical protein